MEDKQLYDYKLDVLCEQLNKLIKNEEACKRYEQHALATMKANTLLKEGLLCYLLNNKSR